MKKKFLLELLAAVILSAGFAYYISYDFLMNPNKTIADMGDGLGTMGGIYNIADLFQKYGFRLFFDHSINLAENIGYGLTRPAPGNYWYNIFFAVFGSFMDARTVYDFGAFLLLFLGCVSVFLLMKSLGVSFFLALVAGFIYMQSSAFAGRISGHLFGLGAIFAPIFATAVCVWSARQATVWAYILFGFSVAIAFSFTEYFGYFGTLFWAVLSFGTLMVYSKDSTGKALLQFSKLSVVSAISCVVLMLFFYWNMLMPQDSAGQTIHQKYAFGIEVFKEWSTPNPGALVRSYLPGISHFFSDLYFQSMPGVFAYRVGIMPIVTIFFGFLWQAINKSKLSESHVQVYKMATILLLASSVAAMFGMHPDSGISLVAHITYKIAPMFRVGSRAFFYPQLCLVVISILLLDLVFRSSIKEFFENRNLKIRIGSSVSGILGILLLVLCWFDVNGSTKFLKPYRAKPHPESQGYEVLTDLPKAPVLDLPFWSPINETPEAVYKCELKVE